MMGYLELKITDQLVNMMNMNQTQQTLEKDESFLFIVLYLLPQETF